MWGHIHSFNKYFPITYYVQDSVLGARDITLIQTMSLPHMLVDKAKCMSDAKYYKEKASKWIENFNGN